MHLRDVSPDLWRLLAGDSARPARTAVYVDARFELAHWRVIAAAASGDTGHALPQELLAMAAAAIRGTIADPTRPGRGCRYGYGTAATRRQAGGKASHRA